MIRLAGVALAVGLLAASGPATAATIAGRVIHPTRPSAASGIEIFLLGITRDAEPHEERTRTDDGGRFSFTNLPDDSAFLLGATYQDIPFAGPSVVLEPGQSEAPPVTFHIYDRTSDPTGVEARNLRWVIEREAATYRVRQTVEVWNETLRAVVIDESVPPALRIPLLKGHGEIEAPFGRLPAGARVENGALEMRGPVLPGSREYLFAYDLPTEHEQLRTELSIEEPVEQVDLLVRDFGVRVAVDGLHPARPVRDGDHVYLRYVGFDLPAGTRIPLEIEPLPSLAATPRWLRVAVQMALAGVLAFFVGLPIERGSPTEIEAETEPVDSERVALASALEDLEFDYATGKLSADDRDRLRTELRRETARSLARRRVGGEERAELQPCECGHPPRESDRFCSACGARL